MSVSLEEKKIELEIQEAELDIIDFIKTYPRYQRYFLYAMLALIIPSFPIARLISSEIYMFSYRQSREARPRSSLAAAKSIQIMETRILPLLQDRYSAYAKVKNPNPDLYLPKVEYIFAFQNSSGRTIKTEQASSFMLPGKEQFVILSNIALPKPPSKVSISAKFGNWQKKVDTPNIVINWSPPDYGDQRNPDGFFVKGSITNTSNFRIGHVNINAIVYDKNRKVIAVSRTFENNLAPGQKRDYRIFWPVPLQSAVGTIEIDPQTDIFDLNNLSPS